MSRYVKSEALPPVRVKGLIPNRPEQSMEVYPVAEFYSYDKGEPEVETPHCWFGAHADALAWAARETRGELI